MRRRQSEMLNGKMPRMPLLKKTELTRRLRLNSRNGRR